MYEIVSEKTIAEYEQFIESHPKCHFGQAVPWRDVKPLWHWEGVFVRDEVGHITGALSLLIRRLPCLPYTLLYGCRGPVCDVHDPSVVSQLMAGARMLAKRYRACCIRLDPDVEAGDRLLPGILEREGFVHVPGGRDFDSVQPRYVFRLSLAGMNRDRLLSSFSSKTRYNIRLAVRRGVTVRVCGPEKAQEFARLMEITGRRDDFVVRPAGYFANLLQALGEHARLFLAYYDGQAIAGTLGVWFGDKVWYLYGASDDVHREQMPNYLLQWEMIGWALEKHCRIYDFRGVSGDLREENPLYGLYRFKKGFSGTLTEFIGEYDLVCKPLVYRLLRTALALRQSAPEKRPQKA